MSDSSNLKEIFSMKVSPEMEAALIDSIEDGKLDNRKDLDVPEEGVGSGSAYFGISSCCDFF